MQKSEPRCVKYLNDMISENDAQKIIDRIEAGDYAGITMEDYLQVSFLALISGDEVTVDDRIMYKGNVFSLHACITVVNPPEQVSNLRNTV